MISEGKDLVGYKHHFPDGVVLHIVSIKQRETEPWVIYETIYNSALPKRVSMKLSEFINTYGHLFQNV